MSGNGLARLEGATRALAEARTLDEVIAIRDTAVAAQSFCRAAKLGDEAMAHATEVKLLAERKAGEKLGELEKSKGGAGTHLNSSIPREELSPYRQAVDTAGISKDQAARWQKLAKIDESDFAATIEAATERVIRAADKDGSRLDPLMSSAEEDWHTPPEVLGAVDAVLEGIDLDPCSNDGKPNVAAAKHYRKADDGLSREWKGTVYMNPPYGRDIEPWVAKLAESYENGSVSQAIALLPSRTDTAWIRLLRPHIRCFISGRLKFSGSETSAPFPSVAVYLGEDSADFVREFSALGDCYTLVEP